MSDRYNELIARQVDEFEKDVDDLKRNLEECEREKLNVIDQLHSANDRIVETRAHADALAGALSASLECHDAMTEADGIEPEQIDDWRAALTAYRNREKQG